MDLVPGYMIVTETSPASTIQEISVSSIAALVQHWKPVPLGERIDTDAAVIPIMTIPKVVSDTVKVGLGAYTNFALAALESPLERGTYRVWLYVPHLSVTLPYRARAVLCSYWLVLPSAGVSAHGTQATWRRRSHMPSSPILDYPMVLTYSGHTYTGLGIMQPGKAAVIAADLGDHGHWVHITPYSGALTYSTLTSQEIRVSYFQ